VASQCFTSDDCQPGNTATGTSVQVLNGHGTNAAGIIASRGVVSSVGFAPDAQLVAVRVLDSAFSSTWQPVENDGGFSRTRTGSAC